MKSYVSMFFEQLTPNEIKIIFRYLSGSFCPLLVLLTTYDSEKDEESQYNMFYLYWSLKKAFIGND